MAFRFASDVAILPRVGFRLVPPARGAVAPALGSCGAGLKAARFSACLGIPGNKRWNFWDVGASLMGFADVLPLR
jgi:hypothetical protein